MPDKPSRSLLSPLLMVGCLIASFACGCRPLRSTKVEFADLVVTWESEKCVSASHAGFSIDPVPEPEFRRQFAIMPLAGRKLALVRLSTGFPGGNLSKREEFLDSLELMIRAAGYLHIRFLQGGRIVRDWTRPENTDGWEDFDAITERAFAQEEAADFKAVAMHPNIVYIRVPDREEQKFTVKELCERAGSFTEKRGVAVVIMGKGYEVWDDINRIYEALSAVGFRKVCIQDFHSRGRPILRE